MRFTATLASLSFLGLALAQNTVIDVGATQSDQGGIFQFRPNSVRATNGTVVTFRFSGMPGNHSVTQSTFANPCTPRDGGFDSGWVYLPNAGLSPVPEWNLTITDDRTPIWFFCKQLIPQLHCASGMVGAINAPDTGNTIDAFRQAASRVSSVDQRVNGLSGVGATASARPDPIPAGATAFPAISSGTSPTNSGAANPSSTASGAITLSVSSAAVAIMAGMTSMLLA